MLVTLTDKTQYLSSLGAQNVPHSGGTLLDHLLGVHRILGEWGAVEPLKDAGLFHSIYGTDAFGSATVPFSARGVVRRIIGPEAELIVFRFCVMDRISFLAEIPGNDPPVLRSRRSDVTIPLSISEIEDLANLLVANWFEQRARDPGNPTQRDKALRALGGYLLPAAKDALAGV